MTYEQKLDALNLDIQEYKAKADFNSNYSDLSDKFNKIIEFMETEQIQNKRFRDYLKNVPIGFIKDCIKWCAMKSSTEEEAVQLLRKIKERGNLAIYWFKKGCHDCKVLILSRDIA